MESRPLFPLSESPIEVLHTLSLKGPSWTPFSATVSYIRIIAPGQDPKVDDLIDTQIIHALEQYNITVAIRYRTPLIYRNQLELLVKALAGTATKKLEVQFNPDLPNELLQRMVQTGERPVFNAYFFNLLLAVYHPAAGSEDFQDIPAFILCEIPHGELDALVKTIRPVAVPVAVRDRE